MYFVLLESTGNLIASFRDEGEARAALDELLADDPAAIDDVALLTYDDEGATVADPIFGVVTAPAATLVDENPLDRWFAPCKFGPSAKVTATEVPA